MTSLNNIKKFLNKNNLIKCYFANIVKNIVRINLNKFTNKENLNNAWKEKRQL